MGSATHVSHACTERESLLSDRSCPAASYFVHRTAACFLWSFAVAVFQAPDGRDSRAKSKLLTPVR